MSKFVQYANVIATYSGLNVSPIVGSPVCQAVDIIAPKEEVETEEVLTASLENAIEQTLIEFPGGYGQITESMVNELVAISSARLEFIQTTVAPLSGRFAERVNNNLLTTLEATSVLDYTVTEFSLPKIAKDARFAELLKSHVDAVGFKGTCISPVAHLINETEQTIVNTLESGIADWDAMISDLIASGGEEYAELAYNRVLRNTNLLTPHPETKVQQITYFNNLDNLNDYIVAFLFLNSAIVGGYVNYDKLVSGRESVPNVLRKNAAALASAISAIVRNYEKDEDTGSVILSVDNVKNDILVYSQNFKDFVTNGGEAEVLKMIAISARRGDAKYLNLDTEQLLKYAPTAIAKFKSEISKIESDARSTAIKNSMAAVESTFNEFIESVSALELNISSREQLKVAEIVEGCFAEITEEDFVDRTQEIAIELFCKIVWPGSTFGRFIRDMNNFSRLDPTLTPRSAAYKTFVKEIVSNLLKQTVNV